MTNSNGKFLVYIYGAIAAVFAFLFTYISKLKGALVFKDVCEAKHEGLQQYLDAKFTGLHDLMNQRCDGIIDLFKKNNKES